MKHNRFSSNWHINHYPGAIMNNRFNTPEDHGAHVILKNKRASLGETLGKVLIATCVVCWIVFGFAMNCDTSIRTADGSATYVKEVGFVINADLNDYQARQALELLLKARAQR